MDSETRVPPKEVGGRVLIFGLMMTMSAVIGLAIFQVYLISTIFTTGKLIFDILISSIVTTVLAKFIWSWGRSYLENQTDAMLSPERIYKETRPIWLVIGHLCILFAAGSIFYIVQSYMYAKNLIIHSGTDPVSVAGVYYPLLNIALIGSGMVMLSALWVIVDIAQKRFGDSASRLRGLV